MDIQESLLTHIDTLLRADTALKAAMGGEVRLFLPRSVPPDTEFPYLVHEIAINGLDYSPLAHCTYPLNIYSFSPSAAESLAIKAEIVRLLENLEFTTTVTTDCWLWIQAEGFVSDTGQDIWHYACQFNLRFLKDNQVGILLRR